MSNFSSHKTTISLYKSSNYSLLINPLFYISSIITVLFCAFRFFFTGNFFIEGIGSSDLRKLFQAIPYISILTIPLIVFRLRNFLLDDSLPISSMKRFLSISLSAFTSFFIPIVFLMMIPICVNVFGDVDGFQVISGLIGIVFYGFSAICLTILLFTAFDFSSTVPLIISMIILAIVDFVHVIPLYCSVGSVLTFLLQKISFAWHFDSFGKGIIDSRNIFFYIITSISMLLISVLFEYKRTERKFSKLSLILVSLTIFFTSSAFNRMYFRIDLTKTKSFSVSETSKSLLKNLSAPMRITYYRSKELKDLYPQSSDVVEYLQAFCSVSKNLSLKIENADVEKLSQLKIQGQQIQKNTGTKVEYVTVYSAIILQYLEKQTIIPFVLSTENLEYDLTQRVQQIITGNYRKLLIIAGNGRSIEESYMYVAPLLAAKGFMPEIAKLDDKLEEKINALTTNDELLLLGTSSLNQDEAEAISRAFNRNVPSFIATSPYDVPVEDEWKISKNTDDKMIPILNNLGFAFGYSLVEDLSCFPISMQSGEGNNAEYKTMNYPLWVSILPQENAKQGMTLFWASPLYLYGNAKPLIQTTNMAWTQKEANSELPFITDPFTLPKTATQSDSETGTFSLAATNGKIIVISDQYFVDSLMTGFISQAESVDFRNFDFLCSQLLKIRGDEKIAQLMEKTKKVTTLYKITDFEEFNSKRFLTIFVFFIIIPLIFVLSFAFVTFKRR